MEPPWDEGTKVCSNGPGHMTIYGKNLKKIFFSGIKRPMTLKFGMQHWVLKYYQVCSNDDPGLTLTYFFGKVKFGPLYFCMGIGKTMDFSETIVVYDSKVATDEEVSVDIKTLSPGALCPLPRGYTAGLYTCIK